MIDLIVACAHDNVIGSKNDLPWYLPADLKHFKGLTTGGENGNVVIMGRKTRDSIAARLNGPLPNRRNIVVSTQVGNTTLNGFEYYRSLPEALAAAKSDNATIHIIGGAALYKACLEQDLVDRIYLTEIDADIPGDTYFPELDRARWQETSREAYQKDDKNPYDYSFVTLDRIKAT